MGRRANNEGSIYRRKDGRWEAAAYFVTTSGIRKRKRFYGPTRTVAHSKLLAAKTQATQGIRVPDQTWRLGDYLDYWLEKFVKPHRAPKTYEQYEGAARLYLKPGLGGHTLVNLSVAQVQMFLDTQITNGASTRRVQIMRTALSAALTRAMREELLIRNVARLAEVRSYKPKRLKPWSIAEAQQFIGASRDHTLFAAFALLLFYGMRSGEVLGLRWCDLNFEHRTLHLRQQLQRVGRSLLLRGLKTEASERDLPMLTALDDPLWSRLAPPPRARDHPEQLVFMTSAGTPIEPRNFRRSFRRLCAQHDIRVIRLHYLRHTTTTLLKNLGVPERDIQLILGHASVQTTRELYEHGDLGIQEAGLTQLAERLLGQHDKQAASDSHWTGGNVDYRSRQILPSSQHHVAFSTSINSGGPSGARTQDTLLKSSPDSIIQNRLTEVNRALEVTRSRWFVGLVAVNFAVRSHQSKPLRPDRPRRPAVAAGSLHRPRTTPSCVLHPGRE
jgi:integrase